MENIFSYTSKKTSEICDEMGVSLTHGLSDGEAGKRLRFFGHNEINGRGAAGWHVFMRQFASSFVYLLLAAGVVTFFLGEKTEALMIGLFVFINACLGFWQEYHSERTMKLMRKYLARKVKLRRDGADVFIVSRDLVVGDVIFLEAGDIIPADVRLVRTHNFLADESILTGESKAVVKQSDFLEKKATDVYGAANIGFSGTTVQSGSGQGIVLATGNRSQAGILSLHVQQIVHESVFEKKLKKFSSFVLLMMATVLFLVVLAHFLFKKDQTEIIPLLIFAIALAVSVMPEALPVVLTFSLSRGAMKLAKRKVVVKRLSAIEDLGSITVLCSDKTGTLTENRLSIEDVYAQDKREAIFFGVLSSLFFVAGKSKRVDPFDRALWERLPFEDQERIKQYREISKIPFDPVRRRSSVKVAAKGINELIVRGAPEIVAAACRISDEEKENLFRWIADKGKRGMRVMAIAKKIIAGEISHDSEEEMSKFDFMGCISFTDPLKESALDAIQKAKKMGVQIKIITGDSLEVSGTVAFRLGLIGHFKDVISGEEFMKASLEMRREMVKKYNVFARILPEEKYEIIKTLREIFEVGFLGEGINDAPALKMADVGLAVSGASDIAQDAADVVLLEKNLDVVVDGIREGRKVFSNTMKYIKTAFASNFGNFYALAFASLFINFLPMMPLQILLVNLLSDLPMVSIATDNVDHDELRRPRSYNLKEIAILAIILGLVSTVFDVVFFRSFVGKGEAVLQTSWFIGSVLTELTLLFSIRTNFFILKGSRPSWVLAVPSLLAFVATLTLPFTGFGKRVFHFQSPPFTNLAIIFGIVVVYFAFTEGSKLLYCRFLHKKLAAE